MSTQQTTEKQQQTSKTESKDVIISAEDLAAQLSTLTLQEPPKPQTVLGDQRTLKGVAEAIREGKLKNIIVLSGAGISVAAGIPDFRTPGTGLYDNLQKYNLPRATAVFEIDYFRTNPSPFYELAREMFPGNFRPTPAHYFVKLLQDKKILLRNFTQNIDTLERVAGVEDDKLVEAHGSFAGASCIDCKKEYPFEDIKKLVTSEDKTIPRCEGCKGLVKPNIVFFGESLPKLFSQRISDFRSCDLLLVMGTSLQVYPFANLVHFPPKTVPRVLINRELAGDFSEEDSNNRDVIALGDIQEKIHELVEFLGWKSEFEELMSSGAPSISVGVPEQKDDEKPKEPASSTETQKTQA